MCSFSFRELDKARHSLVLSPNPDVVRPILWKERKRNILSVIPYTGGKAGLVPSLIPLIEWAARQYDLKAYYEVTGGGGRCLLNLDASLFEHRVYSDVDLPLCCLFQALKSEFDTEELISLLYRQDYTEDVFRKAVSAREHDNNLASAGRYNETSSLIEAAAHTIVAALMSQKANFKTFDSQKPPGYYDRLLALHQFVPILHGTRVLQGDCRELISNVEDGKEKYQPRQCLIYVDPPYDPKVMKGKEHYKHSWTREDHLQFRDLIRQTETYMIISGYSSDIYNDLQTSGWRKIFVKNKHVSSSGTGLRAEEYIYINFELSQDMFDLLVRESGRPLNP
jgi:site-specific DNA-adenine methylase